MDLFDASLATAYCALARYNYALACENIHIRKHRSKRRCWTLHHDRSSTSIERKLPTLDKEPSGVFDKFTWMSEKDFEYLLHQVSPFIAKKNTRMREAVSARIRLAITLTFLATGDGFKSLHCLFRVSPQLISRVIPEVCVALNQVLKNEIRMPTSPVEWLDIEKGFKEKFPRCVGSLEGKQVVLQYLSTPGLKCPNYKKQFSIVLFALVDSNSNFIFAETACEGSISDGSIFENSVLWQNISSQTLNLPAAHPLEGSAINVPYVFLGDSSSHLSYNVTRPYTGRHVDETPKRIFNQTLSRTRVVVENAFGMLCTRFRIFKKPIALCPEKVKDLTMTCILLHNFLRKSCTSSKLYAPPGTTDNYDNDTLLQPGSWREETDETCAVRDLGIVPRRTTMEAREIREEFTNYFYNSHTTIK